MSSVPAIHNIIRHSVDDCTVIVIVSRKKKKRKDHLCGPMSTVQPHVSRGKLKNHNISQY